MARIKQFGSRPPVTKQPAKKIKTRKARAKNQDRWFLKLFENHLSFTKPWTTKGVFYPSMLGNLCDKYLYLAYNGELPDQVIEAKTARIFDVGSSLEVRMKRYFERMGIFMAAEQSVKLATPPISGRYDFLLRHEEYDTVIVELKSINELGFDALIDEPKSEHLVQLQIYLNIANIEHGIVLYENKNDQKLKAFKVIRNEQVWENILDRCLRIQNMQPLEVPTECNGEFFCLCRRKK